MNPVGRCRPGNSAHWREVPGDQTVQSSKNSFSRFWLIESVAKAEQRCLFQSVL